MNKIYYIFPLFTLLLSACNAPTSPSQSESESKDSESVVPSDPRPDEFLETSLYTETMSPLGDFTPTTFNESSLSVMERETLSEGVEFINYTFTLNSGNKVIASTIEVDLTKADIRTNYSVGASSVLYTQMNDFQNKNQDVTVIAGINADFFARGGSSVNAYIKDDIVIKSGHNDNGLYDYTNLNADIPASMPMLLGVDGEYARIAPIVENKSVEETIKSKFEYKIKYAGQDKVVHDLNEGVAYNLPNGVNKLSANYTFVDTPVNLGVSPSAGDTCYVLEVMEGDYKIKHAVVSEIWPCDGNKVYTDDTVDGYAYFFTKKGFDLDLQEGDFVGVVLGNEDSKFDGYSNIIGGRQSLVENGKIAPTVKLENSTGAQSTNVPRSAVAIKDDGKLLICAIEALRYGKKSNSSSDGYGVNLPELAEFLREINCYDALNFDGGGSTSLITKNLVNNGDYEVKVRSSDYGTYSLTQSRQIYNSLLITTKK